jgi:hypothetical protein
MENLTAGQIEIKTEAANAGLVKGEAFAVRGRIDNDATFL